MHRRTFVGGMLLGGAGLSGSLWSAEEADSTAFELALDVATKKFDGKRCWCHPRAGIVPQKSGGKPPRVVMTLNTLNLSGSDVFEAMHYLWTDDLGQTWTEPRESEALRPRIEQRDGEDRPLALSDFWPTWHGPSGKLLGTGHTVAYTPQWKLRNPRPRHTGYSVYDPQEDTWSPWQTVKMPDEDLFNNSGAGCAQRYDEEDGTILLPISYRPPGQNSRVTVMRCEFDGTTLRYVKHGNTLVREDGTRGLHEPSLTRFQGKYLLTIRNDRRGLVSTSQDGLMFDKPRDWKFDDGSDLGNYNTQQHWVTHSDALYLVYTRRGAENDHVFRHRAPLFMAQVDPDRLRVIRETEQVLVPERGARLGNFGITQVSPEETWVTVAEWMQRAGPDHILPLDNPYGADGSVFVSRVQWQNPNRLMSK